MTGPALSAVLQRASSPLNRSRTAGLSNAGHEGPLRIPVMDDGSGPCGGRMKPAGKNTSIKERKVFLEKVFERFHRPEFISPDPLEFLPRYDEPLDREIVGLIASALAYGRVRQILKSVAKVLAEMGPSPRAFLEETGQVHIREIFHGFKHRFTTGEELAELLIGMRQVIREYGSLRECFTAGMSPQDGTTIPALHAFTRAILPRASCGCNSSLIPDPGRKSACKRLHLFLRWMVRSDEIDPGVWTGISPDSLIVPLDTHMFRIAGALGMTSRSQADEKAAREITAGFRDINPRDPVRYDFSLTRLGILGINDFVGTENSSI